MAMEAEESTYSKMLRLRLLCDQKIRACHERNELLVSSIRDSNKSIKLLAEKTLAKRGEVAKLKDQAKELEASFCETLKVHGSKKAKLSTFFVAISSIVERIEHLKRALDEQRAKKDEYETVISQQLIALQIIEDKNEKEALEVKKIQEATNWYKSVLGFQIEGGDGVKFSFNNIDPNDHDKEFWFVVKLDGDLYTLLHCNPQLENTDELVEELNRTNGLFKFVKVMRESFKKTTYKAVLSLPLNSVASRTEMFSEDNPSSQSKKRSRGSSHKDIPTKVAILSPQSITTFRRSPRLMGKKLL